MRMIELIEKKKYGGELSGNEINWMIENYCSGAIPDYQMSAFLMAVYYQGMTKEETVSLTMSMLHSGEILDLSGISGIKADKHSTGGVGDTVSLVLCPLAASLGVKMAKMSGRGLGFTGGTLDKLESIPGFSSQLTRERFFENVEKVGFAIAAQTAELDPADKLLYALRDATATVDSRPLIVSSVMSKKLAAGADIILLDVKTGSGSFCKTEEEAFALAQDMVDVGKSAGKKTVAVVSSMDEPLGTAIGNALELKEAIYILRGEVEGRLKDLCMALGECLLTEAGIAEVPEEARVLLEKAISDGSALRKLAEFAEAQGGDPEAILNPEKLPRANVVLEVKSDAEGFIGAVRADDAGRVCVGLGGGRSFKDELIDLSVGFELKKRVGDQVSPGECIAEIHAKTPEDAERAAVQLKNCFTIVKEKPDTPPLIRSIIK